MISPLTFSHRVFGIIILEFSEYLDCTSAAEELLEAVGNALGKLIWMNTTRRAQYADLRAVLTELEALLDNISSPLLEDQKYYSCFISYSNKDRDFVDRLYEDLLGHGITCWYAPEDMTIGGRLLSSIDEAIQLRDKVLLILSESSIESPWVEDEVIKGYAEEREAGMKLLYCQSD